MYYNLLVILYSLPLMFFLVSHPSLGSHAVDHDQALSQLTARRKQYVKRVSSSIVAADKNVILARMENRAKFLSEPIFESCLLIGLTLSEGENGQKKNLPYVKSFFPENVSILST